MNRLWAAGLCALLASACSSEESAGITTEIVPLAKGDYYGLMWSGTQLERFYLLAHSGTSQNPDGPERVVSPDNDEPCALTGIGTTRYLAPLKPRTSGKYVVGWPSPARVFLFDDIDESGVGTVRFTDIHCKPIDFEIPEAHDLWYLFSPDLTELKLAVRLRDNTLELVDPWKQTREQIAQDVTDLSVYDTGETLIESGRLVQRDRQGKALLRRGKEVSRIWQLNGEGDVAYRDGTALWLRRGGEDKRLSDDGCDISTVDAFLPGALTFYSPCRDDAPRTLHVMAGDDMYTYQSNVNALFIESGLIVFTTNESDKTKVWLVRGNMPSEALMVGEVPRSTLRDVGVLGNNRLFLKTQLTDKTYTVWQLEIGTKPVLTQVAQGLLMVTATNNAFAILQDNGDLLVSNSLDAQKVLLRVPNAKSSDYAFVFGGKTTALAYLSNVQDDGMGSLELHFLSGQHLVLAPDVREWDPVWWPERGIVYAHGGDNPGISFARIDIPCESASDTAWACGF